MNAHIIKNRTLVIDLDTRDGTYVSLTQYNTSWTTISINGLTLPEIINIRNALDKYEKTLTPKIKDEEKADANIES